MAFLLLAASACSAPQEVTRSYLLEAVEVPAPTPPALCADAARRPSLEDPGATLYVFTSDWCAACDRLLARLEGLREDLGERRIAVHHLVTGEGDSCMAASRVARRASFAYGAASRRVEQAWRVRSTPTLWLVDADGTALLYVEGEPASGALIEAIDARRPGY